MTHGNDGGCETGCAPLKPLTLDYERYAEDLAGLELSEAEQREFLEALWNIMVAFVDIGFGVDNLSHIFPGIFAKLEEGSNGPLNKNNNESENQR